MNKLIPYKKYKPDKFFKVFGKPFFFLLLTFLIGLFIVSIFSKKAPADIPIIGTLFWILWAILTLFIIILLNKNAFYDTFFKRKVVIVSSANRSLCIASIAKVIGFILGKIIIKNIFKDYLTIPYNQVRILTGEDAVKYGKIILIPTLIVDSIIVVVLVTTILNT